MQRQAIDLLHVKIMTDQNTTLMGHQRHDWMILLNTTIVATLIMQYFCTNEQGDHTLPELFAQVPFHYSLASDEEELGTYKELTTDYQRFRRITPTQHLELISILEKRLSRGGRIQSDYFESEKQDNIPLKTWDMAMMRIIAIVTAARNAICMSRSYGNPDIVYSFPSNAVPPSRTT